MARLSNLPAGPLKLCVLRSADQRPLRGQTRGGPWRVNCWLPAARVLHQEIDADAGVASLREVVNCRRRCRRPLKHPLGLLSAKHAGWSVRRPLVPGRIFFSLCPLLLSIVALASSFLAFSFSLVLSRASAIHLLISSRVIDIGTPGDIVHDRYVSWVVAVRSALSARTSHRIMSDNF